jgi:hypothetical protein
MNRAIGALLVCGCVWFAVGCKNVDMLGALGLQGTPDGNERVVSGSVDAVAETTTRALGRLNLKANVTRDSQKVYIDTATQTGARFRLVLTREATAAGERTRIRVEWIDSNRNEEVTFHLLSNVEAQHKN